MFPALAAVEEASRAPPPGARAARKPVNSSHPRGRTPSGLERKEGIVSRKLGTVTVTTTRYAGDQAQGVLAFQADPTQCAGSGVTSAAVNGTVGLGSAQ